MDAAQQQWPLVTVSAMAAAAERMAEYEQGKADEVLIQTRAWHPDGKTRTAFKALLAESTPAALTVVRVIDNGDGTRSFATTIIPASEVLQIDFPPVSAPAVEEKPDGEA